LYGALTLGFLTLPVIIGTAEEALRAVPDTYREASLGKVAIGVIDYLEMVDVCDDNGNQRAAPDGCFPLNIENFIKVSSVIQTG
jgi:hypothetical protein